MATVSGSGCCKKTIMTTQTPQAFYGTEAGLALMCLPAGANSSIFWNLETGVLALSEPLYPNTSSGSPQYSKYQTPPFAPAFTSVFLQPPEPSEADGAAEPRQYIRNLLTMSYYLFDWAYGFDFVRPPTHH